MPEGVEIEMYRQTADRARWRPIASIVADDDWYLKGTTAEEVASICIGAQIEATRRIGKLALLDLSSGHVLGLRFGMTGRLILDGEASIESLEYSSDRNDPAWDRFVIEFDDGGCLAIRDPRRLGGVEVDPDVSRLGADVFTITVDELNRRVLLGEVALKARLLDQQRIAGIGNLIADETLWRAGLDPATPAGSLDHGDAEHLRRTLEEVLTDFVRDGGSHTGRLMPARERGGSCPGCGSVLDRRTIGGRTTFSCPRCQPTAR